MILQFVTSETLSDRIIRFMTKSPFSHVDIVLDNGLLGARLNGGVKIRNFDYMKFSKVVKYKVDIPDDASKVAIQAAISQIGKPYDWRAVFSWLFFMREWDDPNKWFCSELIAWAIHQAHYSITNWSHSKMVSPQDLLYSTMLKEVL